MQSLPLRYRCRGDRVGTESGDVQDHHDVAVTADRGSRKTPDSGELSAHPLDDDLVPRNDVIHYEAHLPITVAHNNDLHRLR